MAQRARIAVPGRSRTPTSRAAAYITAGRWTGDVSVQGRWWRSGQPEDHDHQDDDDEHADDYSDDSPIHAGSFALGQVCEPPQFLAQSHYPLLRLPSTRGQWLTPGAMFVRLRHPGI